MWSPEITCAFQFVVKFYFNYQLMHMWCPENYLLAPVLVGVRLSIFGSPRESGTYTGSCWYCICRRISFIIQPWSSKEANMFNESSFPILVFRPFLNHWTENLRYNARKKGGVHVLEDDIVSRGVYLWDLDVKPYIRKWTLYPHSPICLLLCFVSTFETVVCLSSISFTQVHQLFW